MARSTVGQYSSLSTLKGLYKEWNATTFVLINNRVEPNHVKVQTNLTKSPIVAGPNKLNFVKLKFKHILLKQYHLTVSIGSICEMSRLGKQLFDNLECALTSSGSGTDGAPAIVQTRLFLNQPFDN